MRFRLNCELSRTFCEKKIDPWFSSIKFQEKVKICVLDATSPAEAAKSVSADSAVPALEKSIYDPDSLLNTTVNSSLDEGAGEPSTAESTGEMPPAQSVTAISSPGNK